MVIRLISGNLGYNQFTHESQFSSASLIHSEQGLFASIYISNDTSNDNVIGTILIYLGVSSVDGACQC